MNDKIVGEVDVADFKYFVANEILVAGVLEEDEEKANFIVIKSKTNNYPMGAQGAIMREAMNEEVENKTSVLLYSYEEALTFDMDEHFANMGGK
tara:strand:- start:7424 stop:7705 length:282 start_codon:yes stop_codon:yes gene_type:complete